MDDDENCTAADMLVIKKPTRHCDESNENLICDEIIEIQQDIKSREIANSTKNSLAAARNNNYFEEDHLNQETPQK